MRIQKVRRSWISSSKRVSLPQNRDRSSSEILYPIKADRKINQRVITAYESGRRVNLSEVLLRELLTVPQALAEGNDSLRSGSKADLAHVLSWGIQYPPSIGSADVGSNSNIHKWLPRMVCPIRKPPKTATFGDLADAFTGAVLQGGALSNELM